MITDIKISDISTLTMRPTTRDDLPALLALVNAWGHHFYRRNIETMENLQHQFHLPDWDHTKSSHIVLNPDGEAIAYAEVWDTVEIPVRPHIWFCIHPELDNYQEVGSLLMDWGKKRAMEAIERVPEDARFVIQTGTDSIDRKQIEVITNAGMEPTGNTFTLMVRPFTEDEIIAEPEWSDGITVRTAEGIDDLRPIHRALHQAFDDHRGSVAEDIDVAFERWSNRMETNPLLDKSLWFLAMDGDEIIGGSICEVPSTDYPDQGYIDILGVIAPYRRRGIARALLRHSFQEFQRRGLKGANLRVDAKSLTGANFLYTSEGMERESGYDTYIVEVRPGRELTKQ